MTSLHRLGFSATLLFLGLVLLACGSGVLAADADRIEKLISQLGSDNFREREVGVAIG